MADVRDPVGVGLEHDRTTSPQSAAAADTDLRAAARELQSGGADPTVVDRRFSAQVTVGGALFVAILIVLVVSVIWVSENSKHPLVQLNPSPPTTSAPTTGPTVAYGPIPLPATTPALPPPPVDVPAPVEATWPSPVPAETLTPAPSPHPRLPRLHDLFPRLFPGG
jgi:hypothetical protein